MYIAVKYNSDIGFYFAGVGSTLCGIQNQQYHAPPNTSLTLTSGTDPASKAKVETNASDSSS
jgi:hypothetical protein